MTECKEAGQHIVTQMLESDEAPSGAAAVVACVPIPPASQVTQATPKAARPTQDQKETTL